MGDRSRLVVGAVTHRRHRPRANAFRYGIWHLLLDVDHLDEVADRVRGFRVGSGWPVGIRRADHFGPADLPLREKVARWVAGRGATLPDGPLLVYASPAVAGHVFNPVSWWFAHDLDGTLRLVVAEVRNTFGDWHAYLLDDLEVDGRVWSSRRAKDFHVSPFLPVADLTYDFRFRPPDVATGTGRVAVAMDVSDDAGVVVDAVQAGELRPLTTRSLWGALLRYPLVSLRTVALIHWQALRLFWKRTPFHRRPQPPATGWDAIEAPDRPGAASEPRVDPAPADPDPQEVSA